MPPRNEQSGAALMDALIAENFESGLPDEIRSEWSTDTNEQDKMKMALYYSQMFGTSTDDAYETVDALNEEIYKEATTSTRTLKEISKEYEKARTWVQTLQNAYSRMQLAMVSGVAGAGKLAGELITPIDIEGHTRGAIDKWFKEKGERLTEWSDQMLAGIRQYYEEHPEEAPQLVEGLGYKASLYQYVTRPKLLVQSLIETAPLVLEGTLGTVAAGPAGGIALMAVPISGDVYAQARAEGTDITPAAAQAILSGIGEAAIEEWTLGRKLGLVTNWRKLVAGGLPKVLWEGSKAFFRGTAEEGTQEFNRNFWRWVFTDRSQAWSANVAESMAAGGPLELAMAAGFGGIGYAANRVGPTVSQEAQRQRLDKIAQAVQGQITEPKHRAEILAELDRVRKDVDAGIYVTEAPEALPEGITPAEAPIVTPEREIEAKRPSLAARAVEKIVPKVQKESLRDIGFSVAESAKMAISEVRKAFGKKTTPETFTPPIVSTEIAAQEKTVQAKVDEEDKNAATIMENYWREHDEREFEINVEVRKNQEAITEAMGKTRYEPQVDTETRDMSLAMMLYVDLKEHPAGHKFADNLSKKHREIYDLSQNLPANVRQVADRITKQNRKAGELAVQEGVIREARENYVAHLWKRTGEFESFYARFRQTTARAKARTLEGGLVEGLAEGLELRVQDITLASQIAQTQVNQAYVGKKLLKMGKAWGLLSDVQHEDWVEVDHPGFTTWKFAGTAEKAKAYGKNFFVTPEGTLMERVRIYAEPKLGKTLNKVFSPSAIYKIPGAETVTRYNAVIKSTILYTSLFHHQAFLRSYAFGSRGLNPKEAYQKGREAIENMTPEIRLLVRNGLTLGRIQDYDPRMVEGKDTVWGKAFALTKPTEKVNKAIQRLRRQQETFLFNKLGPYLKTQAALLELRAELVRNKTELESGVITVDEIASAVANLMNNDFGGLHLGRMGRSQTMQHLLRLMLLAPDWTESNVRSMIDAFRKGETGYMHRMFWGRIAIKGLGATIAFNLLLSTFDDEDFLERYRRAWKEGHLRWLDIDVTPIYKALGGTSDARKYFSLIGHFRDPVKFVTSPGRSLKHKGSVVSRIVYDFTTGQDWAGRQFTTVGELMGISEDGKLAGRLVKWGRGKAQVLEPQQLASWFVYEGRQVMPIPIQNITAFIAGEADAFDAITKSLGLMTSTTYPERRKRTKVSP